LWQKRPLFWKITYFLLFSDDKAGGKLFFFFKYLKIDDKKIATILVLKPNKKFLMKTWCRRIVNL